MTEVLVLGTSGNLLKWMRTLWVWGTIRWFWICVCLRNQPVSLAKSVKGEKSLPSSHRARGLCNRFWSLSQVHHSRFLKGFEEDWCYVIYSRFLKSHYLLWVGDWTKNNTQIVGTEGNKSCPMSLRAVGKRGFWPLRRPSRFSESTTGQSISAHCPSCWFLEFLWSFLKHVDNWFIMALGSLAYNREKFILTWNIWTEMQITSTTGGLQRKSC